MIYTNNLRDIASPLDQFEIRNLLSIEAPILGDINISITNIGLYLLISVFIVLTTSVLATNYNKIISNS
jgi:F-type H+-transporting ATPase subunit a